MNRQEAIAVGIKTYLGSACKRHPKNGSCERYVADCQCVIAKRGICKAWRDAHASLYKASVKKSRRKLRVQGRVYDKKYQAQRRVKDPNFKLRQNLRARLRQSLKGSFKVGSAVELLGCSISELKAHLESQFKPGMSWANWSRTGWHIDHIKPLAFFNLEDSTQLAQACHYTNLQPLWAKENLEKSDGH